MTLVAYSVATPEKWQAVECLFELLTFLLEELQNQKENFKVLKEERLGITCVATGQSVEDILVHNLRENN
ncbi:hypothetical protein INT48_006839 [Thamnidium elegans]|uniref:Uncharacterized protein n=1 Tax=Thamnidium elegans TaxID=101142 RepID=A0A8H7SMF8_9FUNG|nr:hypothetical protein INT48_006839 [Thamnidium elegans]